MNTSVPHIPRFKILRELGRGGMGAVFLALDLDLERQVAIKILDTALTPVDYERFRREAMAVAQMKDPYIISLYDIGHDSRGHPYFVMEHVEGRELTELIKTERLSMSERLELFTKVTQAVAHAHSKGILHRDLKPQNILIRPKNNDPCLLDFGLARLEGGQLDSITLTAEGSVMGTLAYMSPEQADGTQATIQSDLWGLGATFYHLFTGQPPFPHASSPYQAMTHIFTLEPKPPKELNPEIPKPIHDCLLQTLEKDPEDRFESAQELLSFLEEMDLSEEEKTPKSALLLVLILMIFLLGALILAGVFALSQGPKEQNQAKLSKGSPAPTQSEDPVAQVEEKRGEEKTEKETKKDLKKTETKKAEPKKTEPKKVDPKAGDASAKSGSKTPKASPKPESIKKQIELLRFQRSLPVTTADPVFRDFNGDGVYDLLLTCHGPANGSTTEYVALSGKDGKRLWRYGCLAYRNVAPLTVQRKSGVTVYLSEYRSGALHIRSLSGKTGEVVANTKLEVAAPKSRRVPSPIYRIKVKDRAYHFVLFNAPETQVFLLDGHFKLLDQGLLRLTQKTILPQSFESKVIPWDSDKDGEVDGFLWARGREISYLGITLSPEKATLRCRSFARLKPIPSRGRRNLAPPNLQEINLFPLPKLPSQCLATLHLPRKHRKGKNTTPWLIARFDYLGIPLGQRLCITKYPGLRAFTPLRLRKSWQLAFGTAIFKSGPTRNLRLRLFNTELKDRGRFAGHSEITDIRVASKKADVIAVTRKTPQRVEFWNLKSKKQAWKAITFAEISEALNGQAYVRDLNGDKVPELIVSFHDPSAKNSGSTKTLSNQGIHVVTLRSLMKKRR